MRRHARDDLKQRVLQVLEAHRGPAAPITMAQVWVLADGGVLIPRRAYDQTRIVRSLIEQLRREGVPIGNSPRGYFLARSDEELAATIRVFHARAMASLRQERALKRVSFTELLEQYKLELDPPRR